MLIESNLAPNVKEIAYDILHTIAVAESIVRLSALLINAVDVRSWSCGPLPCGSGRVTTRHGELPISVPTVVARMLCGYPHVSRWMHR